MGVSWEEKKEMKGVCLKVAQLTILIMGLWAISGVSICLNCYDGTYRCIKVNFVAKLACLAYYKPHKTHDTLNSTLYENLLDGEKPETVWNKYFRPLERQTCKYNLMYR